MIKCHGSRAKPQKYFEAANLDAVQVQPEGDLFGDLRHGFPIAWHALSLLRAFGRIDAGWLDSDARCSFCPNALSGSSEDEIVCELPIVTSESMESMLQSGRFSISMWLRAGSIRGWTPTLWIC